MVIPRFSITSYPIQKREKTNLPVGEREREREKGREGEKESVCVRSNILNRIDK